MVKHQFSVKEVEKHRETKGQHCPCPYENSKRTRSSLSSAVFQRAAKHKVIQKTTWLLFRAGILSPT